MPVYVAIVNWTDQGVKNVKDTVKRAECLLISNRQLVGLPYSPHVAVVTNIAPLDRGVRRGETHDRAAPDRGGRRCAER